MNRRLWTLFALGAALAAPAPAFAAQPLSGFPRRVPGGATGKDPSLITTAVSVDASADGSGRIWFGAGNELHCVTLSGAACAGFPVRLGERAVVAGAPAAGDVDGDRRAEVAVALAGGQLLLLRDDGSPVPGFAFQEATGFEAGPSLIDLDGDGRAEVVAGGKGGKLHALKAGAELPGFPRAVGASVTSPVAAALFGAPLRPFLVSGNEDGKVYALDLQGRALPGFPISSAYLVSGEPALGDLDGNGENDVAFASQDFKVYAVRPDGKAFPGFPASVGARLVGGPALGDLDGDGRLEIAVAALDGRLHAFTLKGEPLKGFPVKLGEKLAGSAVIADLDRDGRDEILAASNDGQLHALRGTGKPFSGFPARLGQEPASGPAVVEGGEGTIVVQPAGEKIYAFKVKRTGKASAPLAWGQPGHDASRSGRAHPNPPSYADLGVTPGVPNTTDTLAAEYRFFDLDGDPEPATEVRWFRDGKEVPELANKRGVPAELTRKKERWRFQVSAPGATPRASPEVVIANSPPGRAKIALDPEIPRRAAALKVRVVEEAPDADGDKPAYSYAWLKDGQPQRGLNKAELPAGALKKGERWTAIVVASDGEVEGAPTSLEAVVADSAPSALEIAVSPAQPKAGDTLQVVIQKPATDVDGDALRYRYRYSVDGKPLELASTSDALPPLSARKKQSILVEVQADDGELLGPIARAQTTVINTAPTAPVPAVTPREARRGETLTAGLADASQDIDGDALTYRFTFLKEGKKVADSREVSGIKRGEAYELVAVASDGETDSLPGKTSLTVRNTAPTAPALAFEALPLRRSDSARVKIAEASMDADGDAISYRWAWFRNGEKQSGLNGPEVPAGTFKKGERWKVTATPFDGTEEGSAATLESLVADSVPSALEVKLSPAEPKIGDAVKAVIVREASDVDGDRLKYRFRFLIDGTPVPTENTVDTLPARTARKKQTIIVEVQADDGELQGPVASAKATVANTAPLAPEALLLPAEPHAIDALFGALARPAADADGDRLTYRFAFTRDGKRVEALADGREVRGLKKGESYDFEVIASDGEADSPAARAKVTVKNTAPTRPAIAFESLPLRRADAARVKIAEASTDADRDAISYRWAWFRNGEKQSGLTGPEVPAGTFKKGERWRVTATPFDGSEEGAAAALEAVVADSAPSALEVKLSPAEPKVGDPVKAVVAREASDVDGDALKYRFRFLVDGTPVSLPASADTLPARSARKKQTIVVEVQADDGELQGPLATAKATVVNTAPEAPKAQLLPAEPRTADALFGALLSPSSDADGDALSYRFSFSRDGKRVEAVADGREVRGLKRGETYDFEAVASDGEAESSPARARVAVINTPPTAPALEFSHEAPPAGEPVNLKIARPSVDADGDAVTYAYSWAVDGKPAGLPADAKAIPSGRIKKHEIWTVDVTPSDAQQRGPAGRARLIAVNTPPTAPVVAIEPEEPTAGSGAKARIAQPSVDRDGDAVVYRYAWYKDGARLPLPSDAAALAPGTIKRGESLQVVVTPFDGEVEGASATRAAKVKNSAPLAPQIALQPERPTVRDSLVCSVKTPAKDPDQETPRLRFAWRRNGELLPVSADQDRIPAGVARHGERWSCEVVAGDGELSSPAVQVEATVANSPPGAPKLVAEPETPRAGQDVLCRLAGPAADADLDPITYSFRWLEGSRPVAVDAKEPWKLPPSVAKKGRAYRCEATASDGQTTGPGASAEARYRNSPPTAPAVRLGPATPAPGSALSCVIAQPAVDPDGDPVKYRFLWQKNGVEQSFAASSAEVPGRLIKPKDIWRCVVTASDAEDDGPGGMSAEVIVPEPAPSAAR